MEQHIRPGGIHGVGYVQVGAHRQGQGLGKRILANSGKLALVVGTGVLELLATDVGSYAWGKFGFLPDKQDWDDKIVPSARMKLEQLRHARHVDAATSERVRKLLDGGNPRSLRALIDQRKHVPSNREDRPGFTTLGRALLIDSVSSWNGTLDLNDTVSRAIFERYTGASL